MAPSPLAPPRTAEPLRAADIRLLRLPEVLRLTGYRSPDTIYRLERDGRFPRHVRISARASRWREDEVMAWIEARSSERAAA